MSGPSHQPPTLVVFRVCCALSACACVRGRVGRDSSGWIGESMEHWKGKSKEKKEENQLFNVKYRERGGAK